MVGLNKLWLLLGILALFSGTAAFAEEVSKETQILGKPTGAQAEAGGSTIDNVVRIRSSLSVFGVILPALLAITNPANTIDGITYTEVYSFGKRVFTDNFYFSHDGIASFTLGLPPIQIRVPVLTYAVGPLLLQLDAGARFHANLQGQNMSTIGNDTVLTSLGIELKANGLAAAFLEGYAKLFILRAGVGGQLDLIDLTAALYARYNFDGTPPLVMAHLLAQFLKGRLYAFIDFFNIFGWGWKRLFDHDLYTWKGFCFAAGAISCPSS